MAGLNAQEPKGFVERVVEPVVEAVTDVVLSTGKFRAADFLCEQLANGPVAGNEIKRRAEEAGITATALRRGRKLLKIKPWFSGSEQVWMWELPDSTAVSSV